MGNNLSMPNVPPTDYRPTPGTHYSGIYLTNMKLRYAGAQEDCEGLRWFNAAFPKGAAISTAFAACSNREWIWWVMDHMEKFI